MANDNGETLEVDSEGWMDSGTRELWMRRLSSAKDRVQTFVMDKPLAAVGAAVATGFLIARIFRR